MHFRVLNGCPVGSHIAPYIAIITADAGATPNSIYRGADAESILAAHGHQSQAQLYAGFIEHKAGYLPANPPGYSTHELRSDGAAYPSVPRGNALAWWQQGFDVDDAKVRAVITVAQSHGWNVWQPYPSGSEYHHLNFKAQPKPTPRTAARILKLRATLPRH